MLKEFRDFLLQGQPHRARRRLRDGRGVRSTRHPLSSATSSRPSSPRSSARSTSAASPSRSITRSSSTARSSPLPSPSSRSRRPSSSSSSSRSTRSPSGSASPPRRPARATRSAATRSCSPRCGHSPTDVYDHGRGYAVDGPHRLRRRAAATRRPRRTPRSRRLPQPRGRPRDRARPRRHRGDQARGRAANCEHAQGQHPCQSRDRRVPTRRRNGADRQPRTQPDDRLCGRRARRGVRTMLPGARSVAADRPDRAPRELCSD